jgi:hypothetical protein
MSAPSVRDDYEKSHPWRSVRPGWCVKTKGGVYTVTDRNGDMITMADVTGAAVTGTPPPSKHVTVLLPGHPRYLAPPDAAASEAMIAPLGEASAARLASALVVTRLGGHVMAERDLSSTPSLDRCPPVDGLVAPHLAAHLYVYHRLEPTDPVTFDTDADLAVLRALHEVRLPAVAHDHSLEG